MNNLISKFVFPFRYWILFICLNTSVYSNGQAFVDLETGAFFTNINDIRNGNNGTLFSLKNTFKTPVSPFVRLRVGYLSDGKNYFSLLYAPFKIAETGTIENDILFDGKNFKANIPIEVFYKFNSYRFTYNRRIINKDNFKLGLGLSAKIRDAGVSLKNSEFFRENFSVGFVPLINLLAWDITQKMGVDFFGDNKVTFSYKDYAHGSVTKLMTLDAHEFLRRFCLHILPPKFVKIRHYGFLSSRAKVKLKIHQLKEGKLPDKTVKLTYAEITKRQLGFDIEQCPCCRNGRMIIVMQFGANGPPPSINGKHKKQIMN